MSETIIAALFAVLVIAVVIGVWLTMRKRRTDHLRDRFGDEYDRTVDNAGKRADAEAALEEREKRVDALEIRPLRADESSRFAKEWREVKATFVDSPKESVLHADRLIANIMKTKGFPMADFDRRYEDLTVNHGDVARHYREGHSLVERHENGSGDTEDLRQAMKHYDALYDEMLRDAETETVRADVDGDGVDERVEVTENA